MKETEFTEERIKVLRAKLGLSHKELAAAGGSYGRGGEYHMAEEGYTCSGKAEAPAQGAAVR